MTKNIEHVLPFEEAVPETFDFNGLDIFNGIIFCHYSNERKIYYEKALKEDKYRVYKLADEEYKKLTSSPSCKEEFDMRSFYVFIEFFIRGINIFVI